LVRWLLEHGTAAAASFTTQIADARVASHCGCGCASIDFAIGGVGPALGDGIGILSDFEYRTAAGHVCGVFVFERAGLLAGLEVWSMDGLSNPNTLPKIEDLLPLGNVRRV
jgi:hypothetical protein